LIPGSSFPQPDVHTPPSPKYLFEVDESQVHVPLLVSGTLSRSQLKHSYSDGPDHVLQV